MIPFAEKRRLLSFCEPVGTLWLLFLLAMGILVQPAAGGVADPLVALHAEAREAGLPPVAIGRLLILGYQEEGRAAILALLFPVLREAKMEGLPLDALMGKIEEGLAKNVPVDVLLAALRRLKDNLAYSRQRLAPFRSEDSRGEESEQAAAILAGSFELGLDRETVDRFCQTLPPQSPAAMVAVALENKALLGQLGFRADLLDPLLQEGLTHGALGMEWRKLAGIVVLARQRMVADEAIAAAAGDVLKRRGGLRELLPQLGFTSRSLSRAPLGGMPVPTRVERPPESARTAQER